MLFNTKNQIVTLTTAMIRVCAEGLQDLTDGKSNTKNIRARQAILSPLRETKQHPNPWGRGTNGIFSMEQRAKFVNYTAPANTGLARSGRERFVLTN